MRAKSFLLLAILAAGCGARAGGGVLVSADADVDGGATADDLGGLPGVDVVISGIDAVIPGVDVVVPGVDVVRPGIDVVNPQPGPGTFGAPCTRLTDCMSGVCLPTGRCSRACAAPGECPGSWQCTSLPGLGPVCACTPRGAEVCNDVDDDCDGMVDEGFSRCNNRCVDLASDGSNCGACGVLCGGGTACVGGSCVCPSSTPLACGGRCVNPNTDASNCGGCGRACTGGAQCVNGACQTAGVCPSSCSTSSECAPCRAPGETGNYCCVSGLCIFMTTSCSGTVVDSGLPDALPTDTGSGGGGTDARLD